MREPIGFYSDVRARGEVTFPEFTGARVMMMPVIMGERKSLPEELAQYRPLFAKLSKAWGLRRRSMIGAVGYLTIDEQIVPEGRTHRRPGIHVDGIGPDRKLGGWGGGGGYASSEFGMVLASTHVGCRAWKQWFAGYPDANGDCAILKRQCDPSREVLMQANVAYWCGPLTVHEPLVMPQETKRQFIRLSGPSTAPWYDGYTVNPLGFQPTGPIHAPRPAAFMRGEN